MKTEHLIGLIAKLVEDRVSSLSPVAGPRGFRGIQGDPGKDFSWAENEESIKSLIKEAALKFSDFTDDQIEVLRGPRGHAGKDGSDFDFESRRADITDIISVALRELRSELKLNFSELTEDEQELIRGPRGHAGARGRDGKDFVFEEHEEFFKSLKLKFSDLTEEEREALKGSAGRDGRDGKDFVFEEHEEFFKSLKLKFSDLTDEEKSEIKLKYSDLSADDIEGLRGPRGQRGKPGRDGKDFDFEEYRQFFEGLRLKFSDLSDLDKMELKLQFSDLTEDDKESIRGPRGRDGKDGRDGKGFDFEENKAAIEELLPSRDSLKLLFSDLTDEERDSLKLKFENLTSDEVMSLRGPRGQRGRAGCQGEKGDTGSMGPRGQVGPMGRQGIPGVMGRTGKAGAQGAAGQDAAEIVEIEVEQPNKKEFSIKIRLSDGRVLETNTVKIPSSNSVVHSVAIGGVGGGTEDAVSATVLQITRVADEDIEIGDCVYPVDDETVGVADRTGTLTEAMVIGVATESKLMGEDVKIRVMGVVTDARFSSFSVGRPLYLDESGDVVDTNPNSGYLTPVGKCLGGGSILVSVGYPSI